jgi:hypothetical protein
MLLSACASTRDKGPELSSSTGSLTYATVYSARLQELNQRYSEGSTFAATVSTSFADYPGRLSKTDWTEVQGIYKEADEAGRSLQVAEGIRTHGKIAAFVEETQGDIAWRVANHVNNSAQKGGCNCDYDAKGAVGWALKDATAKALEERLWSVNEGHRLVEEREELVGKKNVKTLHEQVQELTETSFFVFIDLVEMRMEMQRRVDEARDVTSTLEDAIADEKKVLNSDAPKARKKAAEGRITELEDAKAPIEESAAQGKMNLEGADEKIAAAQKQYKEAFEALMDAVEQKAKEEPSGAKVTAEHVEQALPLWSARHHPAGLCCSASSRTIADHRFTAASRTDRGGRARHTCPHRSAASPGHGRQRRANDPQRNLGGAVEGGHRAGAPHRQIVGGCRLRVGPRGSVVGPGGAGSLVWERG